jgi:hypothetical protein
MELLDTVVVSLILFGAALYLYKIFKPKKKGDGTGCGCGTVDCKVPKAKIIKESGSNEAAKQTHR